MTFDCTLQARGNGYNKTFTFQCDTYGITSERGITRFPMKGLKVFAEFFESLIGTVAIPPTLLVDFGTNIKTINVSFTFSEPAIKGVKTAVEANEDKMMELLNFQDVYGWLASKVYFKVGTLYDANAMNPSTKGFEGKVNNVNMEWVGGESPIVVGSFEFIVGIDLDIG